MSASSRRALGFGLLAGAGGITLLMLAWLATSGAQSGGIVLGLLLLFVLAGPLAAVGAYLAFGSRAEVAAEETFAGKRRVLEADRLFRRELSARLRQLADMPGVPADRLRRLAERADHTLADESAWYTAVQLDDAQIAALGHYDDLVWERVRWLTQHTTEAPAVVVAAVDQLEQAVDERTDVLVRGRQAPRAAPAELLASTSSEHESRPVQDLTVGDAVSRDGVDYLAEAVATSFADGQTWKLVRLAPSGADGGERWLEIAPAGLDLAWLDQATAPSAPGAAQLGPLVLVASGSATTTVATRTGTEPAVLIRTWRYRDANRVGLVQQWPDGALRAYIGTPIKPRDLDVWPATAPTGASTDALSAGGPAR
jgi:hypothetical protein